MDLLNQSLARSQRIAHSESSVSTPRSESSSLRNGGDARLRLEIGLLRDSLERQRSPHRRSKASLSEREILEQLDTPRSPSKRSLIPAGSHNSLSSLSLSTTKSSFGLSSGIGSMSTALLDAKNDAANMSSKLNLKFGTFSNCSCIF